MPGRAQRVRITVPARPRGFAPSAASREAGRWQPRSRRAPSRPAQARLELGLARVKVGDQIGRGTVGRVAVAHGDIIGRTGGAVQSAAVHTSGITVAKLRCQNYGKLRCQCVYLRRTRRSNRTRFNALSPVCSRGAVRWTVGSVPRRYCCSTRPSTPVPISVSHQGVEFNSSSLLSGGAQRIDVLRMNAGYPSRSYGASAFISAEHAEAFGLNSMHGHRYIAPVGRGAGFDCGCAEQLALRYQSAPRIPWTPIPSRRNSLALAERGERGGDVLPGRREGVLDLPEPGLPSGA